MRLTVVSVERMWLVEAAPVLRLSSSCSERLCRWDRCDSWALLARSTLAGSDWRRLRTAGLSAIRDFAWMNSSWKTCRFNSNFNAIDFQRLADALDPHWIPCIYQDMLPRYNVSYVNYLTSNPFHQTSLPPYSCWFQLAWLWFPFEIHINFQLWYFDCINPGSCDLPNNSINPPFHVNVSKVITSF